MKKIIMTTLIVVSTMVLMSFLTISNTAEKEIEKLTPEKIEDVYTLNNENLDSNCWWEETFKNNFTGKRGVACGSDTSLKMWFTNPYSYSIRVAFYFRDSYGAFGPNAPYVVIIKPGQTKYHHHCDSDGRYTILAARSGTQCRFPTLN